MLTSASNIMKIIANGAFFGCLLLLISCSKEEKKDIKVVEVEKASRKDITQTVRLIGTIQAKRSTLLIAKTIGTLDYVAFPGQKILKKNVIAKLENMDLEQTYFLSESAEKNARDQYERMVQLEKSKLAKKQDVEDRKNQWIDAQKALNSARIEFDKTRFIAPFDGIVGSFKRREGVQVQVGDPIVSFYDPTELIVEFDIPSPILKVIQEDAGKVQEVIIDGEKIDVPHIQKMIDPDTHMSPAYVNFSCDNCVIGSNITLDLVVAQHRNVLVVPVDSTFFRDGKTHVYLVKDNKAVLCPIAFGIREKDSVEITSGLSEGDTLIIRGHERLSPDTDVKIFQPAPVGKTSPEKKPVAP
ncbi:MAG: efflux RND transporter periplasmic adaptor subunit [Alphaproteobacteria bacterium]|nr:efflux RND transporter periplasmic adaptor subunit [Alphaproteobacteria bacterium]